MKPLFNIIAAFCISGLCIGENPIPHRLGWIGDSGSKPVRMMLLKDWPIQTPAAFSDLSKYAPSAWDQGRIGSCVGHGTALAWYMQHFRATGERLPLSRLLIYYNARAIEGSTNADTGCQIADAVQSLIKLGSCKEECWPYDVSKFRQKASSCAYQEALHHRVIRAYKVDNTDGKSIRLALTNGWPVIVGSIVYNGIENLDAQHYVLPMPKKGEKPIGGHCYVLKGHDDKRQVYLAQNSWSPSYANHGDFLVPYPYIHSARITEDCWVLEEVMP